MAPELKVGDEVICVDASPIIGDALPKLTLGKRYTVLKDSWGNRLVTVSADDGARGVYVKSRFEKLGPPVSLEVVYTR